MCLSVCLTDDNTMTVGAKGRDVVEAVLNKIKSNDIFDDDHGYIFRTAYIFSSFGEKHGQNIWMFQDESALAFTRNASLISYHLKIKQNFGIEWSNVTLNDLSKPLFCGLAQFLYITFRLNHPAVLVTLEDQANVCINYDYCRASGVLTVNGYIDKVKTLEHFATFSTTTKIASTLAPDEVEDGLLGIKNKARNIVKNAFNTLKDYNQIANQICNELSKSYSKEEWICVVGEKLSISEHQIPKSLFQFGFNMGTADVFIVVNVP